MTSLISPNRKHVVNATPAEWDKEFYDWKPVVEVVAALEAENAKLREELRKTLDTLRIYSYTEYLDADAARALLEGKE